MAQFSDDFSSYTVDQSPTGWTKGFSTGGTYHVKADAAMTGGKYLLIKNDFSLRRFISLDAAGTPADIEIAARVRIKNTSSSQGAVIGRCNGNNGDPVYIAARFAGLSAFVLTRRTAGGSDTTLTQVTGLSLTPDTFYWIVLRLSGDTVQADYWADGGSRPENWVLETTDTLVSAGNRVGVGHPIPGAIQDHDYDQVLIGTNGDAAPGIPAKGGAGAGGVGWVNICIIT